MLRQMHTLYSCIKQSSQLCESWLLRISMEYIFMPPLFVNTNDDVRQIKNIFAKTEIGVWSVLSRPKFPNPEKVSAPTTAFYY